MTACLEAKELGRALGLTATVAAWLHRRGFANDEATRRFLAPRLADLTRPDAMADREIAARRLASAVRRGERVGVFGDYDCDGMTAAAILTEVLRALGAEPVTLLASRFDGGYGVSPDAVDRILDSGASLVVTCDCGSSDHASLSTLRSRGVEVIVVDHHVVPAEPPPALAVVNPRRPECGFAYKHLASCGLVLSLAGAVRTELGKELDLRRWLDLVALGTIADVVPLDGDNRILVRAGLRLLERAQRPGIRALLQLAKLDSAAGLTARDVAFRLAPRLNAPGRLGRPDLALDLLLARTVDEAQHLAEQVELQQAERRRVQNQIFVEARDEVERCSWNERAAVVVGRQGWNHGVVGIVAGKLAERYGRPVAVIGFQGSVGRGSVRGPRGFRLYDALEHASAALKRFGGHQAAAGLELAEEDLEAFRSAFERGCEACAAEGLPESSGQSAVVCLDPGDDPADVVDDLQRLEPCGESNPTPKVMVAAEVVSARAVRGGHLKLELQTPSGRPLGGFAPSMGDQAETLSREIAAVGQLRRDSWRGGRAVELLVESWVEPNPSHERMPADSATLSEPYA